MMPKAALQVGSDAGDGYEKYDISMEDLSFLISPRNMMNVAPSPSTGGTGSTSSGSTFSPSNPKVSPNVTVDCAAESNRPAASSLRGYDVDNRPIYVSSQTPQGFSAMTKRKPAKKSVFSFDGFDAVDAERDLNRSRDNSDVEDGLGTTDSVAGLSSPEDESPENRRRLKTKPFNHARAVAALTDDGDEDDAAPPVRGLQGISSLEDNSFKTKITSNVEGEMASPNGKWENLSPTSNPRKKGGSFILTSEPAQQVHQVQPSAGYGYDPNVYYGAAAQYSTAQAPFPARYSPQYTAQEAYYEMQLPPLASLPLPYPMPSAMHQADLPINFDEEIPPNTLLGYRTLVQDRVQGLSLYADEDPYYSTSVPRYQSTPAHYGMVAYARSPAEDKKEKGASRTGKSLAEISKRFVTLYGTESAMQYIAGQMHPDDVSDAISTLHRVDSAAETLQVHVRRIYELIKILEILSFIAFAGDKRGKFSWRGTRHFLHTLGSIQDDGITRYDIIAQQNGLAAITADSDSVPGGLDLLLSLPVIEEPLNIIGPAGHEEHFMVEIICKNFLQLFLVGMNSMSMGSVIQKLIPMEDGQTLSDYNKLNATKIRRVYDVTNVLCSLNLLRKKSIPKKKAQEAEAWNNLGSPSTDSMDGGSGKKPPSPPKSARAAGERADTKVLEWTSFAPAMVRQRFLAAKQAPL